jgi:FtsZ-interacting cell division protein YlmF
MSFLRALRAYVGLGPDDEIEERYLADLNERRRALDLDALEDGGDPRSDGPRRSADRVRSRTPARTATRPEGRAGNRSGDRRPTAESRRAAGFGYGFDGPDDGGRSVFGDAEAEIETEHGFEVGDSTTGPDSLESVEGGWDGDEEAFVIEHEASGDDDRYGDEDGSDWGPGSGELTDIDEGDDPGGDLVIDLRDDNPADPAWDHGDDGVVRSLDAVRAKPRTVMPESFADAKLVADDFKRGIPILLNLQGVDRALARRLVDFASGICYALDGSMEKMASQVFLLIPDSSEVSDEDRRRILERGYAR